MGGFSLFVWSIVSGNMKYCCLLCRLTMGALITYYHPYMKKIGMFLLPIFLEWYVWYFFHAIHLIILISAFYTCYSCSRSPYRCDKQFSCDAVYGILLGSGSCRTHIWCWLYPNDRKAGAIQYHLRGFFFFSFCNPWFTIFVVILYSCFIQIFWFSTCWFPWVDKQTNVTCFRELLKFWKISLDLGAHMKILCLWSWVIMDKH